MPPKRKARAAAVESPVVGTIGEFQLLQALGRGTSGEVFEARHMRSKRTVAVKVIKTKDGTFENEVDCLTALENVFGFPKVRLTYSEDSDRDPAIVMDILGPTIETFYVQCGPFSLKTTLMIADELLQRLSDLSAKGIVHKDLKPNNFAIGRGRHARDIFILDLAFSGKFLMDNGEHIKKATTDELFGKFIFVIPKNNIII